MALTTDKNKVIYDCDGSTQFYFDFPILQETDLQVWYYDENNNKTLLQLNTDYTITLNDDNTGYVILNTTYNNGKLLLYREVSYTQETIYPENSPFPAKSHEKALDKLTMETQQLKEKIERTAIADPITHNIDLNGQKITNLGNPEFSSDAVNYETLLNAVGKPITHTVDTIKDLLSVKPDNGSVVLVKGYHQRGDGGGGIFYWDSDEPKGHHNGGTIINPDIPFPNDWNDTTQQKKWFMFDWQPSTNYNVGDIIKPTTEQDYYLICITAGTSGTSEPVWNTADGNSTTDNTVVWQTVNKKGCWKRIYQDNINVDWFGAKGDGITDDTLVIQNVCDKMFLKYGNYNNFYVEQKHPILFFNDKIYRITKTIDLSHRNDLWIECLGKILYDGIEDGVLFELEGNSRFKFYNGIIDLNHKGGVAFHHSGDGYADGDPNSFNNLVGKGNVSNNVYNNILILNQYPTSTKSVIDTIPYTATSWYYSMDDSEFNVKIRTGGSSGFGISIGSSEIKLNNCVFACPNGVKIYTSATAKFFGCVFSLQANDKGAVFINANSHVGELSFFGCYLEHTSSPFLNFDNSTTNGSLKKLLILGGLFAQINGANRIIDIPPSVKGVINIFSARVQKLYGRKIYAPNCSLFLIDNAIGSSYNDYGFEVEQVSKLISNFSMFSETKTIYVNGNYAKYKNEFPDIDTALEFAKNNNGYITIVIRINSTISKQHIINGNVRLTSDNGSSLTFDNTIYIHSGMLVMDNLTINQNTTEAIKNYGGNIRINTMTINTITNQIFIKHISGSTYFFLSTLNGGTAIDASYSYASGIIKTQGNTINAGTEKNIGTSQMLIS